MPPGSDRSDRSHRAADEAVGEQNSNPWGALVAVSESAKQRDRADMMLWRPEHMLGRTVREKEFLFSEPGISGLHCTISRRKADGEEGFVTYIKDSSLNGTNVNGRKLTKNVEAVLKDGDLVSLLYVSNLYSYLYRDLASAKRKAVSGENDENKRPKKDKGIQICEPLAAHGGTQDAGLELRTAEEYKMKLEEALRENAALTETLEKKLQEEKEKWEDEKRREAEALEQKTADLTKAINKEKGLSDYLKEELRKIRQRIDEILEYARKTNNSSDGAENAASVEGQLNERDALREIRVNARGLDPGMMEAVAGPSRYRGEDSSGLPGAGAAHGDAALDVRYKEVKLTTSESMPYVPEDSDEVRNKLRRAAAPLTSADLRANESLPETSNDEEANVGGRGGENLASVAPAAAQATRRGRRHSSDVRSDARSPVPGDEVVGPMPAEQGQGEDVALVEGPRVLQAGAGVLAAAAAQAGHGGSQVGNSDTQPGGAHPVEELLGYSQTQQLEEFTQFGPALPQRPPRPRMIQVLTEEARTLHRIIFHGQEML
ncbi:uncharacterized protein LOC9637457 [Selaginella moellendorffii]|uniref:uncharacterized protein LOC9637457 n=1 Tax=Selaginella moellendorffii TaxID=88036 RepID=UPI000D1C96C3|nr:uncharacterized protein LOC9637457 [Selaginella moellendorffii]|eukprot:XP_024533621.1 uncharacterized protein LOC9637457 [Selaginella moellendorffii]